MMDSAVQWAVESGPPNWVFLLALLTSPKKWGELASRVIDEKLRNKEDEEQRES